MRSDMHKVIVERPRLGRAFAEPVKTGGPVPVKRAIEDGEDYDSGPRRAPSFDKDKAFNEHLSPLKRYLAAQVGRPWDKVYSELCKGVDRRSVIGAHVFQHISDFVDFPGGNSRRCRHGRLYVHPETGILLRRKAERRFRYRKPTPDILVVERGDYSTDGWGFKQYGGLWFRVHFRNLDPHEKIQGPHGKIVPAWEVRGWAYFQIVSKLQCNRKEIARIEAGEYDTGHMTPLPR